MATNPYEGTGDDPCSLTGNNDPLLCGTKNTNEENVMTGKVANVLNAIYGIIGVITVVFIVIGGVKYMTSQGDPGKLQHAKNTIMFSVVGLVIVLSAFAITGFALTAFGANEGGGGGGAPVVASIQITSGNTVGVGKTLQITVNIFPDYAENRTLTFKSSDTSVATVSETGLVTGVKAGTAMITASSSNGVTASTTITVKSDIKVDEIKLDPTTATVKVGETVTIKATITPEDAANETITWTSNDESVATVDDKGVVKGIKEGEAKISAAAGGKSATATITVGEKAETLAAVWEKRNYTHSNGKSFEYWVNVPEGATTGMPFVIFLHGDGEMDNANAVKNVKPVQYIHESKDFIGIAPVGKNRDWVSSGVQSAVKGLIDKNVSEFKVDTSRIYVWGFSRGAIGTWGIVNSYPSFFAAAVPVSCCGTITPSNYKGTKVYALAGSQESNYISCMQKNVDNINAAGGSAKFESVQGQNHHTITANFPYDSVINGWLLKQHK